MKLAVIHLEPGGIAQGLNIIWLKVWTNDAKRGFQKDAKEYGVPGMPQPTRHAKRMNNDHGARVKLVRT
jgi:hypothetical protein